MNTARKKKALIKLEPIQVGLFSKAQAASLLVKGCIHIHSSSLGAKDPFYRQTIKSTNQAQIPKYFWENSKGAKNLSIRLSTERQKIIQQILKSFKIKIRPQFGQKIESVLEELLTNAIFHAYHKQLGVEKYSRNQKVQLENSEKVEIIAKASELGVYISILDRGGNFSLEDVSQSLFRCYNSTSQIENKEGGAGLGMYLVYEAVTHLKIVTRHGKTTEVSCMIVDPREHDPDYFSFNYFEED